MGGSKKDTINIGDVETSGKTQATGQILSSTLVAIDDSEKRHKTRVKFAWRGDTPPSPGAIFVNGINPFRWKGVTEAEGAREIAEHFRKFGGKGAALVGHNPDFDKGFWRSLLSRNGFSSHLVPLGKVDTITEAARAIRDGRLDPEKLKKKVRKSDGSEAPSLSLSSVASALGIEVDETKTHDDDYDTEVNDEVHRRLGRPVVDGHPFNNPYEAERAYQGRIVRAVFWDQPDGAFKEDYFYVAASGTGDVVDGYGRYKSSETLMLRLSAKEFLGAASKFSETASLPPSTVEKITHLRSFSSRTAIEVEVMEPADPRLAFLGDNPPDYQKLAELAERVAGESRLKEREKEYLDKTAAAGLTSFRLKNPEDKNTVIDGDDEAMVPALAKVMAGLNQEEREAKISEIANAKDPPRGRVWAYGLLTMVERYGYRNGIRGFDDARRREIEKAVPASFGVESRVHSILDAEGPIRKSLTAKEAHAVELFSDGERVGARLIGESGDVLSESVLAYKADDNGELQSPSADDTANMVKDLLGCSFSAAKNLRARFPTDPDNVSHKALRRQFLAMHEKYKESHPEKAALMLEVWSDMGESHEEYVGNVLQAIEKNTVPLSLEGQVKPVTAVSEVLTGIVAQEAQSVSAGFEALAKKLTAKTQKDSLLTFMEEAGAVKTEIAKAYATLQPVKVPDDATNDEICLLNLENPALALREIDKKAETMGINGRHRQVIGPGGAVVSRESAQEPERADTPGGHPHEAGDTFGRTQCKVCRHWVKTKNAVAGMGAICARRLGEWLDKGDDLASSPAMAPAKFRRLGEMKKNDSYPIMLVRDRKSGRAFVIDIISREQDGRYLAIDLSRLASETQDQGGSPRSMRDAFRVYLNEEDHEVSKVFKGGD